MRPKLNKVKIILHRIISAVWSTSFSPETWTLTRNDQESWRLALSVKQSRNRRVHLVSRFTMLKIVLLVWILAEEPDVIWVVLVVKWRQIEIIICESLRVIESLHYQFNRFLFLFFCSSTLENRTTNAYVIISKETILLFVRPDLLEQLIILHPEVGWRVTWPECPSVPEASAGPIGPSIPYRESKTSTTPK